MWGDNLKSLSHFKDTSLIESRYFVFLDECLKTFTCYPKHTSEFNMNSHIMKACFHSRKHATKQYAYTFLFQLAMYTIYTNSYIKITPSCKSNILCTETCGVEGRSADIVQERKVLITILSTQITNLGPGLLLRLRYSDLFSFTIFRDNVYSGISYFIFLKVIITDREHRVGHLEMWIGRSFLKGVIIYFCSKTSQTLFVPHTEELKLASVCLVYWLIGSLSDNSGL